MVVFLVTGAKRSQKINVSVSFLYKNFLLNLFMLGFVIMNPCNYNGGQLKIYNPCKRVSVNSIR